MLVKRHGQVLRKSRNSVSRPERWWECVCDQHSFLETSYSYKKGPFTEVIPIGKK